MIICGMHEDFIKIEELGLKPRSVCCVVSLSSNHLIKDKVYKYFLN